MIFSTNNEAKYTFKISNLDRHKQGSQLYHQNWNDNNIGNLT